MKEFFDFKQFIWSTTIKLFGRDLLNQLKCVYYIINEAIGVNLGQNMVHVRATENSKIGKFKSRMWMSYLLPLPRVVIAT